MTRLWLSAVLGGLALAGQACVTEPKVTLSGLWFGAAPSSSSLSESSVVFTFKQQGTSVTGLAGIPGCLAGPDVHGVVFAPDVLLTVGSGATAIKYSGHFLDASHVRLTRIDAAGAGGTFTIFKPPPTEIISC